VPARGLQAGAAPVVWSLTGIGRGPEHLPSPQEKKCGARLPRTRSWTHAPVRVAPAADAAALVVRGGATTLPCGYVCGTSDPCQQHPEKPDSLTDSPDSLH